MFIKENTVVFMATKAVTIPQRGILQPGEVILKSAVCDEDYFQLILDDGILIPAGRVTGNTDQGNFLWKAFGAFEKILMACGLDDYLTEARRDPRLRARMARLISSSLPDFLKSVQAEMSGDSAGGKK